MRSRGAPLALLLLLAPVGAAHADWARFYAPSEPAPALITGPDPAVAGCEGGVPPLSAVPALGEAGCNGPPPRTPPAVAATAGSGPAPLPFAGAPEQACLLEIRAAELRYGIPDDLLLGIGLQEAGLERDGALSVWPWSVNVEGEGRFLRDAAEAIAWVRERQAEGAELIDVGCMQVNLRWHPDAFATLEEAFDPARNVDYAARYLTGLAAREGGWRAAVGRYHSADPDRAARYLAGVDTNVRAARAATSQGPDMTVADAGVTFSGDVNAYLDALVADPDGGARRPLWSAGLGAGAEGGPVYGLYGQAGLRPVLPAFQRNF
jgi:hypothetical protein